MLLLLFFTSLNIVLMFYNAKLIINFIITNKYTIFFGIKISN